MKQLLHRQVVALPINTLLLRMAQLTCAFLGAFVMVGGLEQISLQPISSIQALCATLLIEQTTLLFWGMAILLEPKQ